MTSLQLHSSSSCGSIFNMLFYLHAVMCGHPDNKVMHVSSHPFLYQANGHTTGNPLLYLLTLLCLRAMLSLLTTLCLLITLRLLTALSLLPMLCLLTMLTLRCLLTMLTLLIMLSPLTMQNLLTVQCLLSMLCLLIKLTRFHSRYSASWLLIARLRLRSKC